MVVRRFFRSGRQRHAVVRPFEEVVVGNGRAGRVRSLLAALVLVVAVAAVGASSAQASGGHGTGVGKTEITCTHVTWSYSEFPNAENNTVTQFLKINGVTSSSTFSFNGPEGTDTTTFTAPEGEYIIDARAKWDTNGVKGNFDHHLKVDCKPNFTIEKLQEISGSGTGFTTAPLTGKIGQTVDYEIVVTNNGNTALTFSNFTDTNCDEGTIAGGPGATPVEPGSSTIYTCEHLLTTVGIYTNEATDTGTPGEGTPITKTSNKVVVEVPAEPAFTIEKLQEIAGSGSGFTTHPLIGEVGQTVDYEIVVTNTGNVPLGFSNFIDPKCDEGTIAGGPGESKLAPGATTVYTCDHLLNEKDKTAGSYTNTATVTGTPPGGEGFPATHTSNTVVVNFPGHGKGKGTTEIGCTAVTFFYTGFPNLPNNTVLQTIKANGEIVSVTTFSFNGPEGMDTVTFTAPEGEYIIDARATWNTNGAKGNFDHHMKVVCIKQ